MRISGLDKKQYFYFSLKELYFRIIFKIAEYILPRNLNKSFDGYPYLSIESYKFSSEYILVENSLIKNHNISKVRNRMIKDTVFADSNEISNIHPYFKKNIFINKKNLILANTDASLLEQDLVPLKAYFNKIFATNLKSENENFFKLPIGLEGQAFRSSGNLKNFRKKFSVNPERRPFNFIIGWNDKTHESREKIRKKLDTLENSIFVNRRITAKSLHGLFRKTLFVPAPRGNGPDTHRIWEAIFLGAVPVTIKEDFIGDPSWPIYLIDDWEELLFLEQKYLIRIYKKYALDATQSIVFSKKILDGLNE